MAKQSAFQAPGGQNDAVSVSGSSDRGTGPSPIDVHVGSRIRLRRTLMQMSQEKLGDALGLTFQQVQKYERGANRVGASRLFDLSRVLDVPVSFFFDDMPTAYGHGGGTRLPAMQPAGFAEAQDGFGMPDDLFSRKETVELVRAYYRIIEQPVRKRVLELIKSMGPE
jgi:transcriptional regulator with XRE-family HTH domain